MRTDLTANSKTKRAIDAARLSIFSNSLLVVLKLVVGLMTGSVSVISEAVHSATDLLAAVIALFSVRAARRPADSDHPYGHGKVESLSGVAEALLIFPAAIIIIYESLNKIFGAGATSFHPGPGLIIMLFSALLNTVVARRLYRVARETDSLALEADGAHLSADVLTSFGVVAGLAVVWLTGYAIFDPIVAIIVALVIARTAYRLVRDAIRPLMDTRLPIEDVEKIAAIFRDEDQVLGYHKLRTRKSGHMRYIDVHVMIDDTISFVDAHNLTEHLEDRVRHALDEAEITIHMEPYEHELRHQHEAHGVQLPIKKDTAG